jgi:hypothetical protein
MAKETSRGKEKRGGLKNHLGILGPGVVITILGFIIAYQFVEPAPPRTITIATGDKSGAYYAFAQRYREILARDGVALEIRNTAGSVENVKLLGAKEGGGGYCLCARRHRRSRGPTRISIIGQPLFRAPMGLSPPGPENKEAP